MDENELAERRDRIFKLVNRGDAFKLPAFDGPTDRVLAARVSDVLEHVKELTLYEVYKIVRDTMAAPKVD